jgi:hypothetical protein
LSATICNPDKRWSAIDAFVQSRADLKVLRRRLAEVTNCVRDHLPLDAVDLLDDLDEAGNALRAEMVDQVVAWAFEQGRRAALQERQC